ncbi:MAG TPA: NAD(P)/FAD-dependent oxidoreductase, partial [Burkholderiaceae bacterium]|nr:NAD(P)/FAD-dependent oxidoreductase [Burkholderiaceae bacterium]
VIGSGATAVTLVPALAQRGARVTLLQRSPSYLLALPSHDGLARFLKHVLPARAAARIVRAKNIALGLVMFKLSRAYPARMRGWLTGLVRRALPGQDVARHFSPRYNPWEQRLCIVPDGDLFDALRSGGAEIVTDTIERFTAQGVRLASGRELEADIIVTATGLEVSVLGEVAVSVDGRPVDFAQTLAYKAMMFSGVPNLVSTFGYTNASWTLKADLTAAYTCRLLTYMDRHGYVAVAPEHDPKMATRPFIDFSSGYIQRAIHKMPQQGARAPWRLHQNYLRDFLALRYGRLDDGTLAFTRAADAAAQSPTASSMRTSSNSVPPGTRRNDTTR